MKLYNWPIFFGYALFIGMLAAGYYYNVTFIQLGVPDLGTRLIKMDERELALYMAVLALLASIIAILFGLLMRSRGWGTQFITKLRIAFFVALTQTALTETALFIRSELLLLAWIIIASFSLGIGMPVIYSLTVDLIRVRDRGYVAAITTAIIYVAAPIFSPPWTVEWLAIQALVLLFAGMLGLAILAFKQFDFIDKLALQHTRPEFGRGRYVREDEVGRTWVSGRLFGLVILLFGVFFVDSFGFLRIIATPALVNAAWLSPELTVRAFIAGTHLVAAIIGGVLYSALGGRSLFLWIFGIFALVHLMYSFQARTMLGDSTPLVMPMLYAIAVSLYTVVNFAIWPDISTPKTIGLNAAFGVALSGWAASFISTALAIQLRVTGVPLEAHLRIVDAIAMLFFLAVLALLLIPMGRGKEPALRKGGR